MVGDARLVAALGAIGLLEAVREQLAMSLTVIAHSRGPRWLYRPQRPMERGVGSLGRTTNVRPNSPISNPLFQRFDLRLRQLRPRRHLDFSVVTHGLNQKARRRIARHHRAGTVHTVPRRELLSRHLYLVPMAGRTAGKQYGPDFGFKIVRSPIRLS